MMRQEEIKQHQEANNSHTAPQAALAPPLHKRFREHLWFIIGIAVFTLSVIFSLINNSDLTVNFIFAALRIKLPLLIFGCGLLGASIEFFILLGPRTERRIENRRLRKQIRELETLIKHQIDYKDK